MRGTPTSALAIARGRNKYGAVRCELDGFTFDSKAEMRRYCDLALLQKAGEIRDLFVHPVYPIKINDVHVCNVELDFSYADRATNTHRVEDVKGGKATRTPLSRLKHKLLEACYPDLRVEIVG